MAWLALLLQLAFTSLNQDVIEQRLRQYTGDNVKREATLKSMFQEAGCKDLSEQKVGGQKAPNIICTLPGTKPSTIVVGAHFDYVTEGKGVVDNWSGASLLPSLFESVAVKDREHTYVFIGFSGEEKGLLGSKEYVHRLSKEQKANVRAMINMDTLGVSATKIWLSHADAALAGLLNELAVALKLPLAASNVEDIGSSDSESFREAKIPSMTLHSVTQETWPILHNSKDKIEAIHIDEYYQSYRLIAAYLAYLDTKL